LRVTKYGNSRFIRIVKPDPTEAVRMGHLFRCWTSPVAHRAARRTCRPLSQIHTEDDSTHWPRPQRAFVNDYRTFPSVQRAGQLELCLVVQIVANHCFSVWESLHGAMQCCHCNFLDKSLAFDEGDKVRKLTIHTHSQTRSH
ncbi:hypothetical protein BX666DRAFT_1967689, partial [Dichotomocladium elegans]